MFRIRLVPFYFILVTALLLSFFFYHNQATAGSYFNDVSIEILKSKNKMYLKKSGKIIKEYNVSVGKGGCGDKICRGDNVTPEGEYTIRRFNYNSQFSLFMGLDYPNLDDAYKGLRLGLITPSDYLRIREKILNNQMPPQDTRLGGYIGIHGVKSFFDADKQNLIAGINWTNGCIALTNKDIRDLASYCTVGTKVVIKK
jgi:murein L,D-transpeptidase YafK